MCTTCTVYLTDFANKMCIVQCYFKDLNCFNLFILDYQMLKFKFSFIYYKRLLSYNCGEFKYIFYEITLVIDFKIWREWNLLIVQGECESKYIIMQKIVYSKVS